MWYGLMKSTAELGSIEHDGCPLFTCVSILRNSATTCRCSSLQQSLVKVLMSSSTYSYDREVMMLWLYTSTSLFIYLHSLIGSRRKTYSNISIVVQQNNALLGSSITDSPAATVWVFYIHLPPGLLHETSRLCFFFQSQASSSNSYPLDWTRLSRADVL